jgi:predicted PhzF superfamily epimerase YddE/YHI9
MVAQGTSIKRHGRVSIRPLDSTNVMIGGQTHILIEGSLRL